MSTPGKLLYAQRRLIAGDHQSLRSHMPEVNHNMPDLQIKWHKLGKASISLLERGEYRHVRDSSRGVLDDTNVTRLADTLNKGVVPRSPTESKTLTIPVIGVDFLGTRDIVDIVYLLEEDEIEAERNRTTRLIGNMIEDNIFWKDFTPHVSVATIDRASRDDGVLEAFGKFQPDSLRFEPVKFNAE